jgi:hypothetical protein
MASVRNLKKDIDFLMNEIVADCNLFVLAHPDKKQEEAAAIITDTVELWNQLYERVNNPDGKDNPKLVKKHYKSVEMDLLSESHKLFERISELSAN